jgi:Na+/H+-dicarboxylate symporter
MIGFGVAYVIQPGTYINMEEMGVATETQAVANPGSAEDALSNIPDKVVNILPSNPLESMLRGDMLGVVIFTIIVGLALMFTTEEFMTPALNLLITVQEVSMTVVKWAMVLVPYAVFGLMTQITSKIGINALAGLSMYIVTVLIGLILLVGVYLLIILIHAYPLDSGNWGMLRIQYGATTT